MLTLKEEVLLFNLDDAKGSFRMWVDYQVAGAAIAELILDGRLGVDGEFPVVLDATPPSDEVLAAVLDRISQARRRRKLAAWVAVLASARPPLRDALVDRLVTRGIIRQEERLFLWVIPYTRYPAEDVREEHEAIERVRRTLLEGAEPDARTAALIGLLVAGMAIDAVLPTRQERRIARPRLRALARRDKTADAVRQAIEATNAAVTAAIVAATG